MTMMMIMMVLIAFDRWFLAGRMLVVVGGFP